MSLARCPTGGVSGRGGSDLYSNQSSMPRLYFHSSLSECIGQLTRVVVFDDLLEDKNCQERQIIAELQSIGLKRLNCRSSEEQDK